MELLLWIGTIGTIMVILAIIGTIIVGIHKRSQRNMRQRWYKTWDDDLDTHARQQITADKRMQRKHWHKG